jgi:PhnB protein
MPLRGSHALERSETQYLLIHTKVTMQIQTYLFFGGRCEAAIEFYRKHLGAEVEMLMRFKDNPEAPPPGTLPPGSENKIMHASLRIGDTVLMLSDGQCTGEHFDGFSLSLNPSDRAAAERVFAALSEGGQVRMPLTKTFWSPLFGMLTDPFGVGWMITLTE